MATRWILGISAFYHDSAAALIGDGRVVAAVQEERFSRKKGDSGFPKRSIEWLLKEGAIDINDIEAVVFYEKPWLHFERLMETALFCAPRGWTRFHAVMTTWAQGKLQMRRTIRRELKYDGQILFTHHHAAHAGAAFFPSPFDEAAFVTIDGVGEWETSSWGQISASGMETLGVQRFPHSVGLLYAAFTGYLGFRVNRGEYKVMGLAPYGTPKYVQQIHDELVEVAADGSIHLNLDHFSFLVGERMDGDRFADVFDEPRRSSESEITKKHMDIAASIQQVVEDIVLKMVQHVHKETGQDNLVMGGGVALNSVSNGRLDREGPFSRIWINPAPGDAGSAVGAALLVAHHELDIERSVVPGDDGMNGALLGPSFSDSEIKKRIDAWQLVAKYMEEEELCDAVADGLVAGEIVALCANRMEFGPRALGSRSILADASGEHVKDHLNASIKFRESFRPFAPAVLDAQCDAWFESSRGNEYMQRVVQVRDGQKPLPAITHVDGSARVQSVSPPKHPELAGVLEAFFRKTGIPVLVNTSFNLRSEPIVCSPDDAIRTFFRSGIDTLVLGSYLVQKADHTNTDGWSDKHIEQPADHPQLSRATVRDVRIVVTLAMVTLVVAAVAGSDADGFAVRQRMIGFGMAMVAMIVPRWFVPIIGEVKVAGDRLMRWVNWAGLLVLFGCVLTPLGLMWKQTGSSKAFYRPWKQTSPRWVSPEPGRGERLERMF